jgi:hypothetical protein
MTKHLKRLALAVALCATTTAAEARWYSGNYGPETCIPLDDIEPFAENHRVYDGSGPLHTPEDFAAKMQEVFGLELVQDPQSDEHAVFYNNPQTNRGYAFFDDADYCRHFMMLINGMHNH